MFTTSYQPNPTDFNFAPSAVFAIYWGVNPRPEYNLLERQSTVVNVLSDFTDKTRINADCTIIEIWGNGKVHDMHDVLEKTFPGTVISLLAN